MSTVRVSVGAFIVNSKNQLLIVKRSEEDEFMPGSWEIPGGGVEYGEDPKDTIVREVKEETGLQVSTSESSVLSVTPYYYIDTVFDIEINYLCRLVSEEKIHLSHEHTAYAWITYEEIHKFPFSKFVRDLLIMAFHHPLVTLPQ